jgi:hypothetical protein
MEELYKDIQKWMEGEGKMHQEQEIGKLADILLEGFLWQHGQNTKASTQPTEGIGNESDLQ